MRATALGRGCSLFGQGAHSREADGADGRGREEGGASSVSSCCVFCCGDDTVRGGGGGGALSMARSWRCEWRRRSHPDCGRSSRRVMTRGASSAGCACARGKRGSQRCKEAVRRVGSGEQPAPAAEVHGEESRGRVLCSKCVLRMALGSRKPWIGAPGEGMVEARLDVGASRASWARQRVGRDMRAQEC
ncbi:hypothetical protein DFH09DRAFT_287418 [Mycena vulgaris]|nr:hypothetical protein DFH09DRAFT_287418 [Mycena vulgaris]